MKAEGEGKAPRGAPSPSFGELCSRQEAAGSAGKAQSLPPLDAMQSPPRPQGKVQRLGEGCFLPSLVWRRQLVPLGEHASLEAAECTYDVGKLLVGG